MLRVVLISLALLAMAYEAAAQCGADTCKNQGVCVIVLGQASCACAASWTGLRCETPRGPVTAVCSNIRSTKDNMGCGMKEIVFMIEYARGDSQTDIDHEGDFIKDLMSIWNLDDMNVRIGVVTYHDTVQDVIHIDQFPNNPFGLSQAITNLTRSLQPSGTNDLGLALDFVRTNAFVGSRAGAEKIVVPIVHMTPGQTKAKILPAAQALKDDCITIVGLGVTGNRFQNNFQSTLDADLIKQAVTQPSDDHYDQYRSFSELENGYANYDDNNCA